MGVYANHGVEYAVKRTDGARVVIAALKDTNARLFASRFFAARMDQWLSPETLYNGSFWRQIRGDDFDVALTAEEQEHLLSVLAQCDDQVAEHGWYEVNVMFFDE